MSKNYFLIGFTELLVLLFLRKQDSYVYEITKAISDLSEGTLSISLNTIYTATYKLEKEGMISEYSRQVGRKRTRVYYHIEPKGEEYFQSLDHAYQTTVEGIQKIMNRINQYQEEEVD